MNFSWADWVVLTVIGAIVLAMWFAFRDIERLSQKKDDDSK
jgi:hypothetical protein